MCLGQETRKVWSLESSELLAQASPHGLLRIIEIVQPVEQLLCALHCPLDTIFFFDPHCHHSVREEQKPEKASNWLKVTG